MTSILATHLILTASCLVIGGCTFNLPLPGSTKSYARLGMLTNRIDTSFGEPPRAVQDISVTRGREYDFALYTESGNGQTCLIANNHREAPVSVSIAMIHDDNIVTNRKFPFECVVPPNTRQCIARITPLYKDRNIGFQYSSSWMVGDYNARHAPRDGYRLPWQKGEYYQVSQAFGGPITTHTDRSSRYAVDFSMPMGTPVLAARSGTIVNLEDSFSVGALDKVLVNKANFVDVLHEDGTIATYAHLAEGSVTVRLGQMVSVGEKLGLSGSTGYSTGPHLHFAVWRPEKGVTGFEQVSLPVTFCMDGIIPCGPLTYGTTVPYRTDQTHH